MTGRRGYSRTGHGSTEEYNYRTRTRPALYGVRVPTTVVVYRTPHASATDLLLQSSTVGLPKTQQRQCRSRDGDAMSE
jgi:hypothetical protein